MIYTLQLLTAIINFFNLKGKKGNNKDRGCKMIIIIVKSLAVL